MGWNRTTSRTAKYEKQIDQAFQIFENWAEQQGRSYFGDLVQENLQKFLKSGDSPQQAVDRLIRMAPR
jgi:hypothetical protein